MEEPEVKQMLVKLIDTIITGRLFKKDQIVFELFYV